MTATSHAAVQPVVLLPPRLYRSAQAHPPLPTTTAPVPAVLSPSPIDEKNEPCLRSNVHCDCGDTLPATPRALQTTASTHDAPGHRACDPALPKVELDRVAVGVSTTNEDSEEEEEEEEEGGGHNASAPASAEESGTPSSPSVQIWNPFTHRHHAHGALPASLSLPPMTLAQCIVKDPDSPLPSTASHPLPSTASPPNPNPMSPVGSSAHRRVMEGKRKKAALFKCTMEGCAASFTGKHNLRNHLNSHMKIRPYKCTKCVADFGTRSDLNRHLLAKRHRANTLKL